MNFLQSHPIVNQANINEFITKSFTMKTIIAINIILLVLRVNCEYTSCKKDTHGTAICKKPAEITRIKKIGNSTDLFLKLNQDTSIVPNVFKNLPLSALHLTFHTDFKYDRNFHTLVIKPESFVGLSNLKKLIIENANILMEGNPFATLGSLISLKLLYTNLHEISSKFFESLPNLEELSFEGNRITVLPANTFMNLKNLKLLDMSDNGIRTLERDCFNGLHNLETLILGPNSLPVMPILDGLNKLEKLDLSYNFAIKNFESYKFSAVPNLSELIMYDDYIDSLDPGMFDNLPQLQAIRFRGNKFTVVKKNVFNNLKLLKYLDLSSSSIVTFERDAFSGLNLTNLDLSSLQIKSIEPGIFSDLIIGELTFHHCRIGEIKPFAFSGTIAESIGLEANDLTKIDAHDFSGLVTKELNLGWNKIREIAPNAFRNTSVQRFNFQWNVIDTNDQIATWGLPDTVDVVLR